MDNKLNSHLTLEGARRLEGIQGDPHWEALVEYLKEQERSATIQIMGLNDSAEAGEWERKISKIRGVILLARMIQAIPADAKATIEHEEKKRTAMKVVGELQ